MKNTESYFFINTPCLREFYWNKWKRELEGYNLTITTELELLELSIELN